MKKNIFLSIVLCLFMVSVSFVNASYNNYTDLDFIDANKDEYYVSIYNSSEYTISFMNTNDTGCFFINSSSIIDEIMIDVFIISTDSESKYHKSIFDNETIQTLNELNETIEITYYYCEVALDLDYKSMVDNSIIFRLNYGDAIQVSFTPTSPNDETQTSPIPEIPEKEVWFKFTWILSLIMFLMTILIIRFWMLSKKPHVYVRSKNEYELEYLGRFIDAKYDEKLMKYRIYFKTRKGIFEYFSDLGWNDIEKYGLDVDNFIISTVSSFHLLCPHIIRDSMKISKENKITALKFNENCIEYKLYKFLSFLPMKSLIYSLFKKAQIENNEYLDEIPILILEYAQNTLEYKFNIKYKKRELDENKKLKWIAKKEDNVNYDRIYSLYDKSTKEFDIRLSEVEVIEYKSVKEAIKNRDSNAELKSKFLVKDLDNLNQIKRLSNDNFNLLNQNQDLKVGNKQKLVENLRIFVEKSEKIDENLPALLGKIFEGRKLGASEKDTLREALKTIKKDEESKPNTTEMDKKLSDFDKKILQIQEDIEKNKSILED